MGVQKKKVSVIRAMTDRTKRAQGKSVRHNGDGG